MQLADVVRAVRPVRVAGDVGLLPRRQLGIDVGKGLLGLVLELGDLVGTVDGGIVAERAQVLDLAEHVGDRFFEFKEGAHFTTG